LKLIFDMFYLPSRASKM